MGLARAGIAVLASLAGAYRRTIAG
ncbi:hypothetical protein FRAHR75_110092 [Frankia sp. Hr75.2]|nr:hypothetical protein FRAHR75_110092 [Frankia sp. Hr75.2]SQD95172.1 hypothetical protein FMEAI12_3010008 [Parafrankia sp. Ea1.12]